MAHCLWLGTCPETFKQYVSMGFPAFPDFYSTIEDLIAVCIWSVL